VSICFSITKSFCLKCKFVLLDKHLFSGISRTPRDLLKVYCLLSPSDSVSSTPIDTFQIVFHMDIIYNFNLIILVFDHATDYPRNHRMILPVTSGAVVY